MVRYTLASFVLSLHLRRHQIISHLPGVSYAHMTYDVFHIPDMMSSVMMTWSGEAPTYLSQSVCRTEYSEFRGRSA